jgi:hypothetical protein
MAETARGRFRPKIELSKIAFWSEREQMMGVPLMGTAGASEVAGGYGGGRRK